MTEKTIVLEAIDPLDLFGVNDEKISLIKTFFPMLKIVARGDKIKAIGKKEDVAVFNQKMNLLIEGGIVAVLDGLILMEMEDLMYPYVLHFKKIINSIFMQDQD
mgnify:CR=1 FL=1